MCAVQKTASRFGRIETKRRNRGAMSLGSGLAEYMRAGDVRPRFFVLPVTTNFPIITPSMAVVSMIPRLVGRARAEKAERWNDMNP